jgi:hypothetical protein
MTFINNRNLTVKDGSLIMKINLSIIKMIKLTYVTLSSVGGCFITEHLLFIVIARTAKVSVNVGLLKDRIILRFGIVLVMVIGMIVYILAYRKLVSNYNLVIIAAMVRIVRAIFNY